MGHQRKLPNKSRTLMLNLDKSISIDEQYSVNPLFSKSICPKNGKSIAVVTPSLRVKDAVSRYAIGLCNFFLNHYEFVYLVSNSSTLPNVNVNSYESLSNNLDSNLDLFIHYSIYDPNLESIIEKHSGKSQLYYHGITPPEHLEQLDPITSKNCALGLDQLARLTSFSSYSSNSLFNAKQIEEKTRGKIKASEIKISPPLVTIPFSPQFKHQIPHKNQLKFISIGRIIPHKNFEATLEALSQLNMELDYTYDIIGSSAHGNYLTQLNNLIKEWNLDSKVNIHIGLPFEELQKRLKESDIYLSTSHHEGFGIPIIEAALLGVVPIVFNKGAMPETLIDKDLIVMDNSVNTLIQKIIEVTSNLTQKSVKIQDFVATEYSDEILLNHLVKNF